MTVWAFIPARGGSKRIPRKNLQPIIQHSLLMRAVLCARDAGARPVISTDDAEIEERALHWRATVHRRPAHLATDTAQIEDAIAHWMHRARPVLADDDVVILTQCTAPFRTAQTIRRCVEWVQSGRDPVCVAVVRDAARNNFSGRIRGVYDEAQGRDVGHRVIWDSPPEFRPRSQDARNIGTDYGTAYAFTAAHFRATGLRMAPRTGVVFVGEVEAFDIDTPAQLEHARLIAPHAERLIAMESVRDGLAE